MRSPELLDLQALCPVKWSPNSLSCYYNGDLIVCPVIIMAPNNLTALEVGILAMMRLIRLK